MNQRRKFLQKTALAGTGMVMAPNLTFSHSVNPFKENLKVALIGVGLRGTNHLNNLLLRDDVDIVAICDIDSASI